MLIKTKRLANDTTNAVSIHGSANIFFGKNESDTGMIRLGVAGKNQQMGVTDLKIGFVEYPFEITAS